MRVIKQLRCEGDSRKQRLTVVVYVYIGVRLHDSVSLFSWIEIRTEQLLELRVKCQQYFTNSLDTRACCPSAYGTAVPDIPQGS